MDTTPDQMTWELPAVVWEMLEPLLPRRNAKRGRPRQVDMRRIAAGVYYALRTGTQWQDLPQERFGPPTTVYYYFRQWQAAGVFEQLGVEARHRNDAATADLAVLAQRWRRDSHRQYPSERASLRADASC